MIKSMTYSIIASASITNPSQPRWRCLGTLVVMLGCLIGCWAAYGADEPGLGEKAKEAARESVAAVEEAGRSVADSAKDLWQRVDEARLKNRTPDEIVAWIIMGVLVGAVAGMMSGLKSTGLGKVGRLMLGLVGAFIGGLVVHVGQFDFGWGPVLIRYEELFCSLLGAIVIVAVGKFIRFRAKKQPPET